METYEVSYNRACAHIQNGDFEEATNVLKHCEGWKSICDIKDFIVGIELCTKSLNEEGFSESEIQSECAIIKCQLAYVHQQCGRVDEAQEIYHSIINAKYEN